MQKNFSLSTRKKTKFFKTIGIFTLFLFFFSIFATSISFALTQIPSKENLTDALEYLVVTYLSNETQTRFTKEEVKDFIEFYKETNFENLKKEDILAKGKYSGKPINEIYGLVIQPQPKPCTDLCKACVDAAKVARDLAIAECNKAELECHAGCGGEPICEAGCLIWGILCRGTANSIYKATVDNVCCSDGDPCTIDKYEENSNMCTYELKTCNAKRADNCCPPGCSIQEDKDCAEQKCPTLSTNCQGCIQQGCEWCIKDNQGNGKCVYPCKRKYCKGAPNACRDNVGDCPSGPAPLNTCGEKDHGRCKYFCEEDERKIGDAGKCGSDLVCCVKKKCDDRCKDLGYADGGICRTFPPWCSAGETRKGGCGFLNLFPCCCKGQPTPTTTTIGPTTSSTIPVNCPPWTCEQILANPLLRQAVETYDTDNNFMIDQTEAQKAIDDYLIYGKITQNEVCAVIIFWQLGCILSACTEGGVCYPPGATCCSNGVMYICGGGMPTTTSLPPPQCQPSDCPQPKPDCPPKEEPEGVCKYDGHAECLPGNIFTGLIICGWQCIYDNEDYNKQCDSSICTENGWDNSACGGVTTSTTSPPQCPYLSETKVYPSPASITATFEAVGANIEQIKVRIWDLAGYLVFESNWNIGTTYTWDLKNNNGEYVANGAYLYKINVKGCGNELESDLSTLAVLRGGTTTTASTTTTIPPSVCSPYTDCLTCSIQAGCAWCDTGSGTGYCVETCSACTGNCIWDPPNCPESSNPCYDSDGGMKPYIKGVVSFQGSTYPDVCTSDGLKVIEHYCDGNEIKYYTFDCSANNDFCMDGACTSGGVTTTTAPPTQACTDSDGGINYYIKGTVTYQGNTYTDFCSSDGRTLYEYYCDENDAKQSSTLTLSSDKICVDGVVKENLWTCEDSDGGKDIHVKGSVTVYKADGSVASTTVDACSGYYSVSERYCIKESGSPGETIGGAETIACEPGEECINGRCVS